MEIQVGSGAPTSNFGAPNTMKAGACETMDDEYYQPRLMGAKYGSSTKNGRIPSMVRAQIGPPSRNKATRQSQVFEASRKGKHIGLSLPQLDYTDDCEVNQDRSSKASGNRGSLQTMPV
jgi:hypothetical protein